jgi:hypothetical protein
MRQCALGGTIQAISVPLHFAIQCQSVIRRQNPFYAGKTSLNFAIDDEVTENYLIPIGPPAYGRMYNLGVKSGPIVNGVISTIVPPAGYSPERGVEAIQHLWTYMEVNARNKSMHRMVPLSDKQYSSSGVAAFSDRDINLGGGFLNTGGFHYLSTNHVPFSPLLAMYTQDLPSGGVTTASRNFACAFSGDIVSNSSLMNHLLEEDQLHLKTPPVYCPIDFNMILTQYLSVVRDALQLYVNDDDFRREYNNNNNYFSDYLQIKLTLQEIAIAWRATLMNLFQDTVPGTQSLYPRFTNGSANEFVAFSCGVGCYPMPATTAMLIPRMLKENLTALTMRMSVGGRGGNKNPSMYMPVLGVYEADTINPDDFLVDVVINGVTTQMSPFLPPGVEDPISIIDGKVNNTYAAINDPAAVNVYLSEINRWTVQLGNNLQPCVPISGDGGVDGLSSIIHTMLFQERTERSMELEIDHKTNKKKSYNIGGKTFEECPKEYKDQYITRFSKPKMKLDTIYSDRYLIADISAEIPLKVIWESFLQFWIFPVMRRTPNTTLEKSSDVNVMRGINREPYSLIEVEGLNNFMTVSERIAQNSRNMVREQHALPTRS